MAKVNGKWYRKGRGSMLDMDGAVATVSKLRDGDYDALVVLADGTMYANTNPIPGLRQKAYWDTADDGKAIRYSFTRLYTPKQGKSWCEDLIKANTN